jgi:hypothetical protein
MKEMVCKKGSLDKEKVLDGLNETILESQRESFRRWLIVERHISERMAKQYSAIVKRCLKSLKT